METKMIEENLARLRVHRNNIHRYRRLLGTHLSDLERSYIKHRLQEGQTAMEALSGETFSLTTPARRPLPQAVA